MHYVRPASRLTTDTGNPQIHPHRVSGEHLRGSDGDVQGGRSRPQRVIRGGSTRLPTGSVSMERLDPYWVNEGFSRKAACRRKSQLVCTEFFEHGGAPSTCRIGSAEFASSAMESKLIANRHCTFRSRSGISGSWQLCARQQ